MAVVVPLAGLAAETQPAWAGGLSGGTPDGSGNYAVCQLAVEHLSNATLISGSYPNNLVNGSNAYSWADAYVEGDAFSVWCNMAWTDTAAEVEIDNLPSHWSGPHYEYWNAGVSSSTTCKQGYVDGHIQGLCAGDNGGTSADGAFYCVNGSITGDSHWSGLSSGDKIYFQDTECGNNWECQASDNSGSTWQQCSIEAVTVVADPSSTPAAEPNTYWTGQEVPIPATPTPTGCTIVLDTIDHSNHKVTMAGSAATPPTGVTQSYSLDWGDSTTASTTLPAAHTYSDASDRTATLTVTNTGNGTDYVGTKTATCTYSLSFSTSTGGSSSGGGSTPGAPTSCGWTDVLCMIEAAVAWLFVPGASFFSAWSSFVRNLESKAPFAYVVAAGTWLHDQFSFASTSPGACSNPIGGGPNGTGIGIGASPSAGHCGDLSGAGAGGIGTIRGFLGGIFVLGTVTTVLAVTRRVLASH